MQINTTATDRQNTVKTRHPITIGTWNVRTLRREGRVEELVYEMNKYRWSILGISEVRWKSFRKVTVAGNHKLYYSGQDKKHEYGVGFLVNKAVTNSVISCTPISSRIITMRLKASPFNITLIHVYAPTSSHDEEETDKFYNQIQSLVDKIPKQDITIVLGDFNAKVGQDITHAWRDICGTSCNETTNDNGLKLREFAACNDLLLANTLGHHKKSRITTWHSPDGRTGNQIDYILINKKFRSSICTQSTRTFPKADIGSDHDLVMMTFKVHLKRHGKQVEGTRMKFNLEKLKDPNVLEIFQANIGGKFAPLLVISEDPANIDSLVDNFNTALIETAEQTLGKTRKKTTPWMIDEILSLCDERRKLKPLRISQEHKEEYREINRTVKLELKAAKEKWIEDECATIDDCI